MFSDMAVNMKAKGIVRIGKEMYDKDFANRMECLEENYQSPYECSSDEKQSEELPDNPTHRNMGTQTTKKSNLAIEIKELKESNIQLVKERDAVQQKLIDALSREKDLKSEV